MHCGALHSQWNPNVNRGGGQRFVTHQFLDHERVDAGFHQRGTEPNAATNVACRGIPARSMVVEMESLTELPSTGPRAVNRWLPTREGTTRTELACPRPAFAGSGARGWSGSCHPCR